MAMDPMMNAAMTGIQSGAQQASSITPNANQTQGAPNNRNVLSGPLKLLVDQLNKLGSLLNSQGKTAYANELYKASLQVNKVCEDLEEEINGGNQ